MNNQEIDCPYCKEPVKFCHEDENQEIEAYCDSCNKEFHIHIEPVYEYSAISEE